MEVWRMKMDGEREWMEMEVDGGRLTFDLLVVVFGGR